MELEVAGKEAKDLKATSEQALVARGIGGNKTLLARTGREPRSCVRAQLCSLLAKC